MDVYLYLPIAGVSVNLLLLLGLGGSVGMLSGLFGVGGGFLLTPLLITIGIPPTIATASDANQIVAASASGVYAHWRLGNVDFRMGVFLIIGGFIGGTAGVYAIKALRATGDADFAIQITYVLMLGIIGSYMFAESLRNLRSVKPVSGLRRGGKASWFAKVERALPGSIHFERSGLSMSPIMPLGLGAIVGILAAVMGVGGGFIMVPVMIYLLRMPMHVVVGTSLLQVLFTCMNVTFMHAYANHTVDFVLALILLVGSALGAQIGARISRRLRADQLKILLAVIVLAVMVKMLVGLLIAPDFLLSPKGGH